MEQYYNRFTIRKQVAQVLAHNFNQNFPSPYSFDINIIYGRLKSTLSKIASLTFKHIFLFGNSEVPQNDEPFRKGRGVRDVDVDDEGDVLRILDIVVHIVYIISIYLYCSWVKIIKLVMAPNDRVLCIVRRHESDDKRPRLFMDMLMNHTALLRGAYARRAEY